MEHERYIQVLDGDLNIDSFIKKITQVPNREDPFYVCDLSKLIWLYKNWRMLLPRVELFYAVKCNDYKLVLETFVAVGAGFDCASRKEIRRVMTLGVDPDRIILANPAKMVDDIEYAANVGVTAMTFDSEEELHKVKKHHPKAKLLIRVRCDDLSARYKLGKKFGVPPKDECWHLLTVAKSLDLDIVGVAFHVGSGSENYSIYLKAIAAARNVFDMGAKLGYNFKILDIGGGYPGDPKSLNEVAEHINEGLDKYFPDDTVKIIAEPGKYAVNAAFTLVSQINSKNIIRANKEEIFMYYVDVGIFNAFICTFFGEYYNCRPVNKGDKEKLYPSVVWGPSQECYDRLPETYYYLPDLKIGDWLIFEEIGGYSVSISCGYNGCPVPNICAVIKKEDWLELTLTNVGTNSISNIKFTMDTSMETFLQNLPLDAYTVNRYL